MKRLVLALLLGALFMSLVAFEFMHWYLGGSTPINFENRSGFTLEAVTISGHGFKASLGEVRPNEKVWLRVYPDGESSAGIDFQSNGRKVSQTFDLYLEGGGGYILDMTVEPNLRATASVDSYTARSMLWP